MDVSAGDDSKDELIEVHTPELTRAEQLALWAQPCAFCNSPPPSRIDRIDNRLACTLDNAVPTCGRCLLIRHAVDVGTLYLKCRNVAAVHAQGHAGGQLQDDGLTHSGLSYAAFLRKYDAKNARVEQNALKVAQLHTLNRQLQECGYQGRYRGRKWRLEQVRVHLSEAEFDAIRAQPCYFCGKANSESHRNGVECHAQTREVTAATCVSCCTGCAVMKGPFAWLW